MKVPWWTPIEPCEPDVAVVIVVVLVLWVSWSLERGARGAAAPTGQRRPEGKLGLRWGTPWRVPGSRLRIRLSPYRQIPLNDEHSLLVVGPTRSGKTSRVVLPNLCAFVGSLVATSVKADLLTPEVIAACEHRGKIVIIGDRLRATHRWDPVCEALSERESMAMARALVLAQPTLAVTSGDTQFWYQLAEPIIAAALRASALTGAAMLTWIDDLGELYRSLKGHGDYLLADSVLAVGALEGRQRDSVLLTARGLLQPFVQVERALAPIRVSELLDGPPSSTFLIASTAEQELCSVLFALFLSRVVAVGLERRRERPLLLCLDELANLAPIPNLDRLAAVGVGQGVRLISIVQDLAQLEYRYGRAANSIINNHASKLFMSATADPVTRAYLRDISPVAIGARGPLLLEGSRSMSRLRIS